MQPWCVDISTLLLSALLSWAAAGALRVIGPDAPVIARLGGEAVLPCQLSPVTDAEDMEVTWFRTHPSGQVYHYGTSEDYLEPQRPEYRGRTEFLSENINKGQVALRLHPVLISDGGEYRCSFASSTFYKEAQLSVLVAGSGGTPRIHIESWIHTEKIKLTCTSSGWYPEPEVQWKDPQGRPLTPDSETKTSVANGLFHVETAVTVNADSRDVSCVIRNPVLSEEKEAHVSVSDALFPKLWLWILGFLIPLSLVAVGTIFCVLFLRAQRENKKVKKENENVKKENEQLIKDKDSLQKEHDEISKELEQRRAIGKEGLKKVRKYAANIILDEATAHPYLELTEDRKTVISLNERKHLPDNPERFDTMIAVLGENRFSGGNHYWEVEVTGKNRWTVGLCVDSVLRKGRYTSAYPDSGFWTLCLKHSEYKALTRPRSILNVPEAPQIVGIFLQYEKGMISFYNVTHFVLLYTFKSTFTEPLRPYFYPGPFGPGNEKDLHICKVPAVDSAVTPEVTAETHEGHPAGSVSIRQCYPEGCSWEAQNLSETQTLPAFQETENL